VRVASALQPPSLAASLESDPWHLFFPLGVLLAWAGVLHWLLYAAGVTTEYRAVFHSTAQIQGFMTCVATGFLFTFVPRRTATARPAGWELAGAAAGPVLATAAVWWDHWAVAQLLWTAGEIVVAVFVLRRLSSEGARRVPAVFVWVPIALLAGAGSAVLVAVAAVLGPRQEPELWQLGRGGLLQGMVTALVIGVGGTMLPTLTRGDPAAESGSGLGSGRLTQVAAAIAFLASFPLEVYVAARLGLALRALVAGGALISSARLWRPPTAPGPHRWLIWIAAWLLPTGYALAAADPALRSAALHVVFIGSFALMALSVSLHVALSHGGHPERLVGRPFEVWALGLLLLGATLLRLLVGVDQAHLRLWLGCAAACFLTATLAWAALVVPALRASRLRRP
jgi:uncharacterized protein involved in response to NO